MKKLAFILSILCGISFLAGCENGESPKEEPTEILPTELVLSFENKTLEIGDSDFLDVTVLPEDATNKNVTFTVADPSIVSCIDGLIVGTDEGSTTITVASKAVPTLTKTCSITVTAENIDVTSISLSSSTLTLMEGATSDLTVTFTPSDASDKSVTFESKNTNVATVDENGKVSAKSKGTTEIVATSVNNPQAKSSCTVKVFPKTIEALLTDEKSNVSKIEQEIDSEYVEIPSTTKEDYKAYSLSYGLKTRVTMVENGYYAPTGIEIDGLTKNVDANNQVTFVAEVDDPTDESLFFISLKAKYTDNTPIVGEYTFQMNNSAHISLDILNSDKEHITSANLNDIIYVKATSSESNYVVKALKVTHTTYDIGKAEEVTVSYDETLDLYSLTVPYCYSKVLTFEVTEKDTSMFAGSDLVGTYLYSRSYGINVSNNQPYIRSFNEYNNVIFDDAGEITIGSNSTHSFASKVENGVITATSGTSSVKYYYGKNIIIFGATSSGEYNETPLATSSDLYFAVKQEKGTEVEDYEIIADVVPGLHLYYFVKLEGKIYASVCIDVTNKTFTFDVDYTLYSGESLIADKAVYDITKDGSAILRVGYHDDGGELNRSILTTVKNLYTNDEHTLLFINDTNCIFDGAIFTFTILESGNITITNPNNEGEISLDDNNMKFAVVSYSEKEKISLDIANKVFTGTYVDKWSNDDPTNVNATITFGDSNESITGTILSLDYFKYYWSFTATFDSSTNILTLTIVDRGYSGKTSNFDSSLGKEIPVQLEDGKMTFKSDFTGNQCYYFKNAVFTCSDFHI